MFNSLVMVGLAMVAAWLFNRYLFRFALRLSERHAPRLAPVTMPMPAHELAAKALAAFALDGLVRLRHSLTTCTQDSYDSDFSLVRLTKETAAGESVHDGFIACHEVGHAVIDHSSRLRKWVCDYSVYAQNPKITWSAVIATIILAATPWTPALGLALGVLGIQVVAAAVLMWVEGRASHYGLVAMDHLFDLNDEVRQALKAGARAAQFTQAATLGFTSALLLLLGQFTPFASSYLIAVPALGLALYGYLLVASWLSSSRS